MNLSIELQPLELTKSKSEKLDWLLKEALGVANCLSFCGDCLPQKKLIANMRKSSKLQYQVIDALVRHSKHKSNSVSVPFNIPRSAKFFYTEAGTPCFRVSIQPRKHVILPIKKNRQWQRFDARIKAGWNFTAFSITPRKTVAVSIKKESLEIKPKKNVLGIDINSKCFAITVLSDKGKVLRQLYFGKDIWVKRKKIMERRSMLQSFADKGSAKAIKKLRELKRKETNFVNNRIGEIVKDILIIADKYDADVSIENLKRFKPIGRKVNRKIMSIPFFKFKQVLDARCFDHNITLDIIDSYHTSKWCPNCGAVLKKGHNTGNYSLFKCKCGLIANSDRKASLAIAVKSLLERKIPCHNEFFQFSSRRVPVNGLLRSDDVGLNVAVQHTNQPMKSQRL